MRLCMHTAKTPGEQAVSWLQILTFRSCCAHTFKEQSACFTAAQAVWLTWGTFRRAAMTQH